MSRNELEPISYKLVLALQPSWDEIVQLLAQEGKIEPSEFVEKVLADKKLKEWEQDASLYDKSFRFVTFYDGVSHMEQIWSDHHKTFVDEVRVEGKVFGAKTSWIGDMKYTSDLISKTLILTPKSAAFDMAYYRPEVKMRELANIPYLSIVQLFINIARQDSFAPSHAIKTFPHELQELLNKTGVTYESVLPPYLYNTTGEPNKNRKEYGLNEDEWFLNKGIQLYEQEVHAHLFRTNFYTIGIQLKVFSEID